MAIRRSRTGWNPAFPTPKRLTAVREKFQQFGGIDGLLAALDIDGEPDELHALRESRRPANDASEGYVFFPAMSQFDPPGNGHLNSRSFSFSPISAFRYGVSAVGRFGARIDVQ